MSNYMEITRIFPHPQNPRKELGDISELTSSIKSQGVLQNLTLVPKDNDEGNYYVLLGFRRYEASKLAGLKEVPYTLKEDMDEKTQIGVMLLENMQRSDLTVYEEAQGFQMLMDFGDSINDIAKQVGLSVRTIRKRTNLLKLDQEKFAQSIERGATLTDYVKLEQIRNIETRNSVLEKIGTKDFDFSLNKAVSNEKKEANMKKAVVELKKVANKITERDPEKHKCIRSLYITDSDTVEIPELDGNTEHYFKVDGNNIYLYTQKPEEETTVDKEAEERMRIQEERMNNLKDLFVQAYTLRRDFIKSLTLGKKHTEAFHKLLIYSIVSGGNNTDTFRDIFQIKESFRESWNCEGGATFAETVFTYLGENFNTEHMLLYIAYSRLEKNMRCYNNRGVYSENNDLIMLYELLTEFGYIMSSDETAMVDGTHELYLKIKKCRECGQDEFRVKNWHEDDLCVECAQLEAAA